MARITVEDCLTHVGNHFALVLLSSSRARQMISQKVSGIVETDHKPVVLALREIASGKTSFEEDLQQVLQDYLEQIRLRGVKHAEEKII